MITLGVGSSDGEHAAVVVDSGTVRSAVNRRDNAAACVREAMDVAGLRLSDVDVVLGTSADAFPADRIEVVEPHRGHAEQLRPLTPNGTVVVIFDDAEAGGASVVSLNGDARESGRSTGNGTPALRTAAAVARVLGLSGANPIASLESIATPGPATGLSGTADDLEGCLQLSIDDSEVEAMLREAAANCPVPLQTTNSPHIRAQQTRGLVATQILESLATLIACAAERARASQDAPAVAFAGDAFTSPAFTGRVGQRLAGLVAPLPGIGGATLGAALVPHRTVAPFDRLGFGRAFSDDQIKATLDNCRLEYIYEPHWPRLFERTSQLLSSGALVAWFQGRTEFGSQSLGSRSILCDPSNRYSRENVNVFLLDRPAHAPLCLSMASHASRLHPLLFTYGSPNGFASAGDKLTSAIDRFGRVLYHVPEARSMPELHGLLETHYRRTNVPGLLNVSMTTNGVLTATPRDAIRETFGSTADALVIGKFIIAKDYWLLRR
jgi:predicted NodU family carbamoyl transferase